jgi:outer membrane protein OmpA-like peptidoglycan-associated protein
MNLYCTDCGERLSENATFCSQCGVRTAPSAVPVSVEGPLVPTLPRTSIGARNLRRGSFRVVGIVLGTLLFLGLLGMGGCVYLAFRIKDKSLEVVHSITQQGQQALRMPVSPTLDATDNNRTGVDRAQVPLAHCPAAPSLSESDEKAIIPLRSGLTIVDAWHMSQGDYELIESLDSVSRDSVRFFLSDTAESIEAHRTICREDLLHARVYNSGFKDGDPEVFAGMTLFSLSAGVFNDLKTKGRASITYTQRVPTDGSEYEVEATASRRNVSHDGFEWDEWSGELVRVEASDVQVPMIVNDQRVQLPAIHAKGKLGNETMEIWVVDDPLNPVTLRFAHLEHEFSLQVVKLSFAGGEKERIAESLSKEGTAEVHGIYFDFGSAQIRHESESVLREIAEAMAANPVWKLRVEGHTDNIGGDSYNQELSERRSAAVKTALVERCHVSSARLKTAGFGASRPKESNDTLEGRARNRRVELVRQ